MRFLANARRWTPASAIPPPKASRRSHVSFESLYGTVGARGVRHSSEPSVGAASTMAARQRVSAVNDLFASPRFPPRIDLDLVSSDPRFPRSTSCNLLSGRRPPTPIGSPPGSLRAAAFRAAALRARTESVKMTCPLPACAPPFTPPFTPPCAHGAAPRRSNPTTMALRMSSSSSMGATVALGTCTPLAIVSRTPRLRPTLRASPSRSYT